MIVLGDQKKENLYKKIYENFKEHVRAQRGCLWRGTIVVASPTDSFSKVQHTTPIEWSHAHPVHAIPRHTLCRAVPQ